PRDPARARRVSARRARERGRETRAYRPGRTRARVRLNASSRLAAGDLVPLLDPIGVVLEVLRRELDDLGVLDPAEPVDEPGVDREGLAGFRVDALGAPGRVAQLHLHAPRLEVEAPRLLLVEVEGAAFPLPEAEDLPAVERVVVDPEPLAPPFRTPLHGASR